MGQFIQQVLDFLTGLGYWGIMLGLMIEIIPSEIVLAYAGFLVARGEINFVEAIIFGTIGGVIAQLFIYWIGLYGGRPFVEKYGKYILIKKKHIDSAENWFNQYGGGVIFTARFIPVVRHAISIPAGIARMPFWKFTMLTTLAIIPWSVLFVWLGERLSSLGKSWNDIHELSDQYTIPFIAAAVGLLSLYFIIKILRNRKKSQS
ncbi:DedA family protein [Gorillibacterium timonense]|uniref:DedA family protein n=1 Tax=Gorillibacterium timonense TaxID=1689269 RepID=UPI00071C5A03|nr:DedA family protein [Gorillibacterium timonense]